MKWFMGDPHFGHKQVIDMCCRPYKTVQEMDDALIAEINQWVERKHELYILGDFCWERPAYYRQAIRCKHVHLIYGNHDRPNYGNYFTTARDAAMVKFCSVSNDPLTGKRVLCHLSHYPHAFWPASHKYSLHLYGHLHRQREAWLDLALGADRRSMDCGVDYIRHLTGRDRPINEFEVAGILCVRAGHDRIEFYKAFQAAVKAKGMN